MSELTQQECLSEILRRLDIVVCLLLERSGDNSKVTTTDKIMKLRELGASSSQVAEILQKSLGYVTGAVAMRRKAKHNG